MRSNMVLGSGLLQLADMNLDVKSTFNIGNKGFNVIRSIRKDIQFMMGCVCSTARLIAS